MAFAVLLILLITSVASPRRQPWRAIVAALSAALAVAFLAWRFDGVLMAAAADDASAFLYVGSAIDALALLDFLVFVLLISRFRDPRPAARAHARALAAAIPAQLPHVDVWIATYNEEWAILEKTLIAAQALDWPADRLHIHVLDDGRRAWLAVRCTELGVSHVTRPDNVGRKAGNHNNALHYTDAPFIPSLDADFIVFPQAVRHLIGFFAEADVAIVQSPQVYYNPEPFRNNLLLHRFLPDDLDLFYKVMQPGRDAWNATFYCGTSAMLRRAALVEADGFATQGDIEDQITSMKLWQRGWRTIFVGEQLSVGLAPESLSALHDQRNRWCRGSLQINVHLPFPVWPWLRPGSAPAVFAKPLGARRLDPALLCGVARTCVAIWRLAIFARDLGRGHCDACSDDAGDIDGADLAVRAQLDSGHFPGVPAFHGGRTVADCAGVADQTVRQTTVEDFASHRKGPGRDPTDYRLENLPGADDDHPRHHRRRRPRGEMVEANEMLTAIGWTILDLLTCFELPYRRTEERFAIVELATIDTAEGAWSVQTQNLSLSGALIRLDAAAELEAGQSLTVRIAWVPPLPAKIIRILGDKQIAVAFAPLSDSRRTALIRRVFLGPEPKPDPINVRGLSILGGVARRLTRSEF